MRGLTYEVVSSGKVVWVNSAEGCCIGRFSPHGIDVHHDAKTQMATGRECLDCIPGASDLDGWEHFKISMFLHHAVVVGDKHRPRWLPSPVSGRTGS